MRTETSDDLENIQDYIIQIYNNKLKEVIRDYLNDNDYYEIKKNTWRDLLETIFQELFNTETCNILHYHGYDYDMDRRTLFLMIIYIKEKSFELCCDNNVFVDMFDVNFISHLEAKIINLYCYLYSEENCSVSPEDEDTIKYHKMLINIQKIENNQQKNKKLIHLFNRYNNFDKQKKTIIKILDEKYNQDIIQNIISAY